MLLAGSCHYNGFYGTPKVMLLDGVFTLTSPIVGNPYLGLFQVVRHLKAIRSLAHRLELQRQLTLLQEAAGYGPVWHR
jgi:hypothetical protein